MASFYELPVPSSIETFPEHAAMRAALGDVIRQAWPNCMHAAKIAHAVVDLDDNGEERIDWRVRYELSLYQQNLGAFLPENSPLMSNAALRNRKYVDQRNLIIEATRVVRA